MVVGPSGPGAAGQRVFDLIVVARARVIAPAHMEVVYKGALELLPGIAKGDHDLRGDDNANSRARNQCGTDYDVIEVAGAFVRIAPSGPSSHDPCRCSHAEQNGSARDRDNHEGSCCRDQRCSWQTLHRRSESRTYAGALLSPSDFFVRRSESAPCAVRSGRIWPSFTRVCFQSLRATLIGSIPVVCHHPCSSPARWTAR
jgi:hypothetical protein